MKIKFIRAVLLIVGLLSIGISSVSIFDSIIFGEAFSLFNLTNVIGYGGVGAILLLTSRSLKNI